MSDPKTWREMKTVDDAELWETQQILKASLIKFVRDRLVRQAERRGDPPAAIERYRHALDLDVLTIGFARRFATYKRAGLVLRDVERLREMVGSSDRPIQLVFAGKAHPEDHFGKELMQNIVRLTKDPEFSQRVRLRRGLRHERRPLPGAGVDVWLNNRGGPRRRAGPPARRSSSTAGSTSRSSTAGGPRRMMAPTASRSAGASRTR